MFPWRVGGGGGGGGGGDIMCFYVVCDVMWLVAG